MPAITSQALSGKRSLSRCFVSSGNGTSRHVETTGMAFDIRNTRTITGATAYTELQHGPVPKGIVRALEALEAEDKIAKSTETYYGRPKTMFLARTRPDLSPFGADEIAVVEMIADVICQKHTAASISGISHDALWSETEIGSAPYATRSSDPCRSKLKTE
jgi:hypothetical protein